MSILSLLFTLTAFASGSTLTCGGRVVMPNGPQTFISYPYLMTQNDLGESISIRFATVALNTRQDFGSALCLACGWGTESTFVGFKDEGDDGEMIAVLGQDGALSFVGPFEGYRRTIQSLTCR